MFEMPVVKRHEPAEDELRVQLPEDTPVDDRENAQGLEYMNPAQVYPSMQQLQRSYSYQSESGPMVVTTPTVKQQSWPTSPSVRMVPVTQQHAHQASNVAVHPQTPTVAVVHTPHSQRVHTPQVVARTPGSHAMVHPSTPGSQRMVASPGSHTRISNPRTPVRTPGSMSHQSQQMAQAAPAFVNPTSPTRDSFSNAAFVAPTIMEQQPQAHMIPQTPHGMGQTPHGMAQAQPHPGIPQTPHGTAMSQSTPRMAQTPHSAVQTPRLQHHNSSGHAPMTPTPMMQQQASYPPKCLMSVKPADQMDHHEASRWIGTIGRLKKWEEAELYAANCLRHEISGFMLSQLTMADLENVLGMKKHGHRLELWCSIRQIFPYLLPFERKKREVPDEVASAEARKWESSRRRSTRHMLSFRRSKSSRSALSRGTRSISNRSIASSCMSETSGLSGGASVTSAERTVISDKDAAKTVASSTRLLLTLKENQEGADKIASMTNIRKYFLNLGFKVEIGTVETAERQFILFFRDEKETNRALSMNDEFKYDVAPYAEPAKKRSKRPTPAAPIRYMTLNRSRLRAGKSLKSEWKGELYKGDVVWVNQIKGRRARIIRAKDDPTVRGWVSLRSNNGFQLLTQFQDNE